MHCLAASVNAHDWWSRSLSSQPQNEFTEGRGGAMWRRTHTARYWFARDPPPSLTFATTACDWRLRTKTVGLCAREVLFVADRLGGVSARLSGDHWCPSLTVSGTHDANVRWYVTTLALPAAVNYHQHVTIRRVRKDLLSDEWLCHRRQRVSVLLDLKWQSRK